MPNRSATARFVVTLGALCVLIGVICNEWVLVAALSPDGSIQPANRVAIRTFNLLAIGFGAFVILARRHPIVGKILLCGASCAVALVAGEVALRFLEPESRRSAFRVIQPNPEGTGSHRLIRNLDTVFKADARMTHEPDWVIKTNSHGMRWREVQKSDSITRQRVAFLGDSFTFGMSADRIENSFVGVFDSSMDEHKYEILNFGVPGFGYRDMELLLKEEVLAFHPQFVVIASFNGNDIRDSFLGVNRYDVSAGTLSWRKPLLQKKVPSRYLESKNKPNGLLHKIKFYGLLCRVVQRIGADTSSGEVESVYDTSFVEHPHDYEFSVTQLFKRFTFWSQIEYPDVAREALKVAVQSLGRMKRICDDNDVQMLIVSLPFAEQVYSRSRTGKDPSGVAYDIGLPQKHIADFAKAHRVPHLDILDDLRRYVRKGADANDLRPIYTYDSHLNNEGHRLVGDLIVEFFKRTRDHHGE